ncbi:histidine kinase N-terminal 7TM domain-containing diguanylate cyclase [Paenibacillus azoreducens]|nr:diguanylate cyclase [Paenibacillus azoreducens]
MAWIDLAILLLLFILWVYMFVSVSITTLHKVYLGFHFFMMLWPFCQFAIKTTEDPELQLLYVKLAFLDMALLAVGWFFFTLLLTGHSLISRKKLYFAIPVPAVIVALGVMLNPNGLFVRPLSGGYVQRTYGPLFWITAVVLIGYGILSLYMIYRTLVSDHSPRIKKQVKQVLKGILVVVALIWTDILVNVIYPFPKVVIPGLTSLGILLSAVFFVVAIHRDKVFNLISIAHRDIINTITLGIVVLDDNEMIMEINQSLPPDLHLRIGDRFDIHSIFPNQETANSIASFIKGYRERPLESAEIDVSYGESDPRYVHIHVSPIMVGNSRVGRIITFQDMSELHRLIDETTSQNEALQERNQSLISIQEELFLTNQKLRLLALTDSLTGCYNRNYLTQQLGFEVKKNMEDQTPFSILLLDIDFFKLINDNYGHLTGDEVICGTVELIKQRLRKADILARFGGEEFIIYLPGTDAAEAYHLAEQIRSAIEGNAITVTHPIRAISITVSIGLLSIHQFPIKLASDSGSIITDLLQAVDQVLYKAKREGRNRIVSSIK